MREPENIRAVSELDINLIGFVFHKESPRYVQSISANTGIIPDRADANINNSINTQLKRVGVFVDEMPQTLIAQLYNYKLDYLQLHGSESAVYIENLKRTIIPDIAPDIKIIKTIGVNSADDIKKCREYEGLVDMFLFDTKCLEKGGSGHKFNWQILADYNGNIPFILSGGISPDDADAVLAFSHPQFAGIDLNSRFELSPALKDIDKLKAFVEKIRTNEQDK